LQARFEHSSEICRWQTNFPPQKSIEQYHRGGDLGAIPGGIANPINNPFGLRSGLCGATFSATLGFDINPAVLGR
jgi:hypothetical protein